MSIAEVFEGVLSRSRFTVIVAATGSAIVSLAVFFTTTIDAVLVIGHAAHYADFHMTAEARSALRDAIVAHVVEVVDGYLLAAVLLIFCLGLYELFIREIRGARPQSKVLLIESFDDLKDRLAKVILLILIVNLFRDALEIKLTQAVDLVYQAVAIALVGLAVHWAHGGAKRSRAQPAEP